MNGNLLLTDQRLVFDSMKLGGPFVIKTIGAVMSLSDHYVALTDIVEVSAVNKRPTVINQSAYMRVDLAYGSSRLYIIQASLYSKRDKNIVARDDAVTRIAEAIKR